MDRSNVDTDQIIPKQFLKRIERTGFGEGLFFDWRCDETGQPRAEFELNAEKFKAASILVARQNFGCGSSREHAVWAIDDYGFRSVIAQSFADIFSSNCFKNGVLPVTLLESEVNAIFEFTASDKPFELTVDLVSQVVSAQNGFHASFEVNPYQKKRMLNGLDDIAMTLQNEDKIKQFEESRGY